MSRLDFEPGLDAQRKREEIERAKKNSVQDEKRAARISRRGYRDGMRSGNYRQAMQAYEFGLKHNGTSGAGIKQAGVQEGAISSRFNQTNAQLDSFNGQRRDPLTSGGRATNPNNQYQEGQTPTNPMIPDDGGALGAGMAPGPVISAFNQGVNSESNESFAQIAARRTKEVALEGSYGSLAQKQAQAQTQSNLGLSAPISTITQRMSDPAPSLIKNPFQQPQASPEGTPVGAISSILNNIFPPNGMIGGIIDQAEEMRRKFKSSIYGKR